MDIACSTLFSIEPLSSLPGLNMAAKVRGRITVRLLAALSSLVFCVLLASTPSGDSGDELSAKTVGMKQPGSAVSGGSDKMQVVQPVIMPLVRHAGIVALSPAHMGQHAMYAPSANGSRRKRHRGLGRRRS